MIYVERAITITNNTATIESPIVLYKGDKNVQLLFTIKNNPFKYKNALEPTYGQLIVKREKADPIFSEIAKLSNNRVQFIITEEMIDELKEVGGYTFQIRLLNDEHTSRGTLPPVEKGIEIREPILEEPMPNSVNVAIVNIAEVSEEEVGETFINGEYNRNYWFDGDKITDGKLNKIEDAIATIQDNKAEENHIHPQYIEEIPSEYAKLTDIPSIEGLASTDYVDNAIENAQLSGEGIDLSEYAKKEEMPTKTSQLENDSNFLTQIPSEYVTETELRNKGYLTQQDISGKADVEHEHEEYAPTSRPTFNGDVTILNGSITLGTRKVGFNAHSSVTFGSNNQASGSSSVAFGENSVALSNNQFVSGKYNESDDKEKYVHIVGNGTDETSPSNAYTLDWDGNAVYSGKVTVGAEPTEDMDLTTKKYVDNAIENIDIPQVDLTDYATKEELDAKAEKEHIHEQYLTEHQSLEGYATEIYVTNAIANAQLGGEEVDLSGYATKTDLENYAPKEHIHEQYLTEHQDISHLATKEELFSKDYNDLTNKPNIPSIEGLATEEYVDNAIENMPKTEVDLTEYAKKEEIPTATSQLTNDSGFLTEHQDISHLATKEEIPSLDEYAKKEELTTATISEMSVNLTTNKYQYIEMTHPTPSFVLPYVTTFTEIHVFFVANTSNISISSSNVTVKFQDALSYEVGNTYELIGTYVPNIGWLVGMVVYKDGIGTGENKPPQIVE